MNNLLSLKTEKPANLAGFSVFNSILCLSTLRLGFQDLKFSNPHQSYVT
jgi:hypothetical protein